MGRMVPVALRAWFVACVMAVSARGEVVFDNTHKDFLNMYWPSALEYGDEVFLAGTGRTVREFQAEYFGEFAAKVGPTAIVRFYRNDGASPNGEGQFSEPGTLLYQTESLPVYPGYNVLAVRDLAIDVPNHFTWTIQFSGLSGSYSNRAGLVFYDPAAVGMSYDDFWLKLASGKWQPCSFDANPKANFATRIIATPDTTAEIVSRESVAEGYRLVVHGPAMHGAIVEVSTNQVDWTTLQNVNFAGESVEVVDRTKDTTPRYHRIRLLSQPILELLVQRPDQSRRQPIRVTGEPSKGFVMEVNFNPSDPFGWFPMYTNDFRSMYFEYLDDKAGQFGRRFYRASYVPDLAMSLGPVVRMTNDFTFLSMSGPPGKNCVIEYTDNMKTWNTLSTNTFCYSFGRLYTIDPGTTNRQLRFYRVRYAP